jgi:hypothetical protein
MRHATFTIQITHRAKNSTGPAPASLQKYSTCSLSPWRPTKHRIWWSVEYLHLLTPLVLSSPHFDCRHNILAAFPAQQLSFALSGDRRHIVPPSHVVMAKNTTPCSVLVEFHYPLSDPFAQTFIMDLGSILISERQNCARELRIYIGRYKKRIYVASAFFTSSRHTESKYFKSTLTPIMLQECVGSTVTWCPSHESMVGRL